MGLFDDLMYPDNKNRAMRATELVNDCAVITQQLVVDKTKVDDLLQGASASLKQAYANIAKMPIPIEQINITDGWTADMARAISPIVVAKGVSVALNSASKAWLLSQGRLGEAAFADLVGLPRWMKVGNVMGGVAAAVAVEAIVDAVDGAVNRDRLQEAIKQVVPPRITLKRNAQINSTVLTTLQSVVNAFDAIQNVPGLSKDQLDNILQNLINQHQVNVAAITDDTARTQLAALDSSRGSWTSED